MGRSQLGLEPIVLVHVTTLSLKGVWAAVLSMFLPSHPLWPVSLCPSLTGNVEGGSARSWLRLPTSCHLEAVRPWANYLISLNGFPQVAVKIA